MSLTYGFCLDDLSSMYNSAQFSDAFHSVVGDGITPQGTRLTVTVSGFTVTVGSGYALASGRWLSNDEPLVMTIRPSGNNDDRTDALVVRVNHKARKVALEILVDIDSDKLPSVVRDENEYSIILYLIRIRRGVTTLTPEDVTDKRTNPDLCGTMVPLSTVSEDVLYIYNFLLSGIDKEVARIISLSQAVVDKANEEIEKLGSSIQNAGGGPQIGELQTVRSPPVSGWLLCDGGPIPAEYPALSGILDGVLPNISGPEDRYRTYIYGGKAALERRIP